MKRKILLFIIPVIFLLATFNISSLQGPYYYSGRYDPSYVYLISSLNLSQGAGVGHIDHPGTTVQIIGAVVLRIKYLLSRSTNSISETVFANPESYLYTIDTTLTIIMSLGILLMGFLVYSGTKSIPVTLFLQISPLFCFMSIDRLDYGLMNRLSQVSSEKFLTFVILILIGLLIKYIYDDDLTNRKLIFYTFAFAIICGIGMATKIVFAPLLIIPFIVIKGTIRKLTFVILSIIIFLAVVLPCVAYPNLFYNYLVNTALNSGRYGKGAPTLIDPSVYMLNLKKIFVSQLPFFIIIGSVCIILFYAYIRRKNIPKLDLGNEAKILFAIILSIVFNIVLISKNYYQHYILSSMIFTIPCIFLIVVIFRSKYSRIFSQNRIISAISVILIIFISINYTIYLSYVLKQKEECKKIIDFVNSSCTDCQLILSFGVSSNEFALAYGSLYGAKLSANYKSILAKHSSGAIYYEIFNGGNLRSLNDSLNSSDSALITKKLLSGKTILFMSKAYVSAFDQNKALLDLLKESYGLKGGKLTKLFSNSNVETVFELNFTESLK